MLHDVKRECKERKKSFEDELTAIRELKKPVQGNAAETDCPKN